MPPITPYTADLDNREPISAMRDTVARIRAVVGDWRPDQFNRSYAPGKWDARQILTHLAQSEIALGYRARMAFTSPGYAAQSFDQDAWMARESATSGHDALDAFVGTAALNIALFASLSERSRRHPVPPRIRLADRRLDHPPDGRPSDSPSEAARSDRDSVRQDGWVGWVGRTMSRKTKGAGRFPYPPFLPIRPIPP